MLGLRGLLYFALVATGGLFSVFTVRRGRPRWAEAQEEAAAVRTPSRAALLYGIGFVTDFLDTLGIGSFAVTTALFRLFRLVPDRLIPGTMMVGHLLPTIAETLIYVTIIEVDTRTLVLLVSASALGAWLGARVVAGLPRRAIQIGMGTALLAAASIMLARMLGTMPAGGQAIGLVGMPLLIGLVGNLVLGALMTIGIGAYAPSLILFGLLGMNVKAIFPIMMGSCAFIMPAGGVAFVRRQSYSMRAALGLTLGGVPGVLLAAFVVRELPLGTLRWLVLAVVVYTAASMLWSARRQEKPNAAQPPATPVVNPPTEIGDR